jgi:hypothetical protein
MYDYIIIGSGPSGGTISKNLHDAGAKVLLVEAGKFMRKGTFPKTEQDYSAQLFWGGGIEFDADAKTAFLRARVMGGTSIVNQCLQDRFDDVALSDWKERSGIDYMTVDAMDPYYERVETKMSLHTFDQSEFNRNAELFTAGCDKLGYKWKYLRRGQTDCKTKEGNDCLLCLGGCHRDSKQSSLVASIQIAEKSGMEILPEFEVEKVEHFNEHVLVHGKKNKQNQTLKAKKLVLASGSFGTTKIMLNSGFKDNLPALGKGFCQHPQFMLFGIYDQPVDSHKGAFQTVASYDSNFRKKGFKLENVFGPPISIAMLINSIGKIHQTAMKKYRHMACIEVAVRDQPEGGGISLDKKGKLIVKKVLTDQDKKRRDEGLQTIINIFNASGAKEVVNSP